MTDARTSTVLHMCVSALTPEELAVLRVLDRRHGVALSRSADVSVSYAHLTVVPKADGWIIFIPGPELREPHLYGPGLAAIVAKADEVGAYLVDLDRDEGDTYGLPSYEEASYFIRHPSEPRYLHREKGWVERAGATYFDMSDVIIRGLGDKAFIVKPTDLTDTACPVVQMPEHARV